MLNKLKSAGRYVKRAFTRSKEVVVGALVAVASVVIPSTASAQITITDYVDSSGHAAAMGTAIGTVMAAWFPLFMGVLLVWFIMRVARRTVRG